MTTSASAINELPQESFAPSDFDSGRLNLHTGLEARSDDVVLLVHGLSGSAYGTWGETPRMIFDGDVGDRCDVALYDYASARRAIFKRGANLEHCSQGLAERINDLDGLYQSIYVAGHSLGGVLAAAAIQQYLTRTGWVDVREVTRVAALVLFAAPRAGSGWAVPLLRPFLREFRWLERFSQQLERTADFYTSHVQSLAVASTGGRRFLVPQFACIADNDRFVNKMSGTLHVPVDQRLHLEGSHTSIVKPTEADHPQLRWLTKVRRMVNDVRAQWYREREQAEAKLNNKFAPQPVMITELRNDAGEVEWEVAYNEARRRATTTSLRIEDWRDAQHASADLLIVVVPADSILSDSAKGRVMLDYAYDRHKRDDQLTVGVAPVGATFAAAEAEVRIRLPPLSSGSFYVQGASGLRGLQDVIIQWVDVVATRDPRRNRNNSRMQQLLQLEADPFDDFGRNGYL